MVAQDNRTRAEGLSGRGNARVHGLIGESEIIVE